MTSIQILFLGFCVLGLFGSLSLVTPHVLWNDLTYFFRKDRKEYLRFSNRYHGKMYLVIGLISFVLFLVSWFVRIVVSLYAVFFVYIAFWMLAEVLIQIHWLRKSKKD
jgi:cobalamin biosynthesis protein CobD/CbiB